MTTRDDDICGSDCSKVYASLEELLDGEVTRERRAVLRAHIEACPECFEQIGIEEEVRELMRRCCCTPAPETLRQRIIVQLRIQSATYTLS